LLSETVVTTRGRTCSGIRDDPHVTGTHLHLSNAVSQFLVLWWQQQTSRIHLDETHVSVEHPVQFPGVFSLQTRVPEAVPADTKKDLMMEVVDTSETYTRLHGATSQKIVIFTPKE
jgi:hypothetical protein